MNKWADIFGAIFLLAGHVKGSNVQYQSLHSARFERNHSE
jgi:hypothetical protein